MGIKIPPLAFEKIDALKHEIYRVKSVGLLSLSLFRILSVVLDK